MIRTFSTTLLAAAAAIGVNVSAQACDVSGLQIKSINLNAEGVVTRGLPTIRDQLKLEEGDDLILNAAPTMVDARFQVKITRKAQDRDSQGIFSTTYRVTEISTSMFGGGTDKATHNSYFVKVKGNYLGNGEYSRTACDEVTKTKIDIGAVESDEGQAE